MSLFIEIIIEILSWTIFVQILKELVENITGNFRDNFRKFSRTFYNLFRKLWKIMKITENFRKILRECRYLLRKFCITFWENFKRICEKIVYKDSKYNLRKSLRENICKMWQKFGTLLRTI